MQKQNAGIENEKTLWHGTSAEATEKINYYGFNRSYCGKNGMMLTFNRDFRASKVSSADKRQRNLLFSFFPSFFFYFFILFLFSLKIFFIPWPQEVISTAQLQSFQPQYLVILQSQGNRQQEPLIKPVLVDSHSKNTSLPPCACQRGRIQIFVTIP